MLEWRVDEGDCLERLRELESGSIQTCVTSPPYFGLRDYGHEGQIGLEATPDEYVAALISVFREVRRVLRDDGTLWLNLGDSYYSSTATQGRNENRSAISTLADHGADGRSPALDTQTSTTYRRDVEGLKPKDLLGIPWMVAFALRADGWYLRSDIIWSKPNPMPESVTDRPTKAHEYLFLLSKSPRYLYDHEAIKEPAEFAGPNGAQHSPYGQGFTRRSQGRKPGQKIEETQHYGAGNGGNTGLTDFIQRYHGDDPPLTRNKRSVWEVTTIPFPGAHFAVFPPKLIEPCILAGSRVGDTVLDPFAGAGTTGLVATRHGRGFVGIELNPVYAEMARQRIRDDQPLFNYLSEVA